MNNKKTPEGVYSGCVGVSKNYLEWHWKVEHSINNKCGRRDGDVLFNIQSTLSKTDTFGTGTKCPS